MSVKEKIAATWIFGVVAVIACSLLYAAGKLIYESTEPWFWIGFILFWAMTIWSCAQWD